MHPLHPPTALERHQRNSKSSVLSFLELNAGTKQDHFINNRNQKNQFSDDAVQHESKEPIPECAGSKPTTGIKRTDSRIGPSQNQQRSLLMLSQIKQNQLCHVKTKNQIRFPSAQETKRKTTKTTVRTENANLSTEQESKSQNSNRQVA